jgi:hypothetical protein
LESAPTANGADLDAGGDPDALVAGKARASIWWNDGRLQGGKKNFANRPRDNVDLYPLFAA